MPEAGEAKELISGPGTLDEYLIFSANHAMKEISTYENQLQTMPSMRQDTQRIIDRKKAEFKKIDEARQSLADGNKAPGLAILDQEISQIKQAIRFNKENHNYQMAQDQNAVLVLLQMLSADEKGIEPKYFGTRSAEDVEPYKIPEKVGRSDLITASLFKTVYSLERHVEIGSGMMYRPSAVGVTAAFDKLFDYENSLTIKDKNIIKEHITSLMGDIKKFENEDLRADYDTSYPQSPLKESKPQEIMRLRKPHEGSRVPNAITYIQEGMLMARYSADKSKANAVVDIASHSEGVITKIIGRIDPMPKEVEDRLASVLSSKEFMKQWKTLYPNGEPYIVYL